MAVLPTPARPTSTGLFFFLRASVRTSWRNCAWRPMSGSSAPSRASAVRSRPTRSRIGVPAGPPGCRATTSTPRSRKTRNVMLSGSSCRMAVSRWRSSTWAAPSVSANSLARCRFCAARAVSFGSTPGAAWPCPSAARNPSRMRLGSWPWPRRAVAVSPSSFVSAMKRWGVPTMGEFCWRASARRPVAPALRGRKIGHAATSLLSIGEFHCAHGPSERFRTSPECHLSLDQRCLPGASRRHRLRQNDASAAHLWTDDAFGLRSVDQPGARG